MDLPPKLWGTAAFSPLTSPMLCSLVLRLGLLPVGKFGVSLPRGEWPGESLLDLVPFFASPARLVRGETRPV